MDVKVLPVASPSAKANDDRKWSKSHAGLVGLVNIGNSCYMNAAIQALSNWYSVFPPVFHRELPASPSATASRGSTHQKAADALSHIFKKIWASDKPPGHLSPRVVCSAMQNKIFKTTLQQDSQEFMRCLLMQIHDETAVEVPLWVGVANKSHDRSCDTPGGSSSRNSTASSASHDSNEFLSSSVDRNSPVLCKTSPLPWKKGLARLSLKQKPTGSIQSLTHGSPTNYRRFTLRGPSSSKLRSGSRESDETGGHLLLQIPTEASEISLESQPSEEEAAGGGGCVRGEEGMVYEVDLTTRYITVHRDCHIFDVGESTEGACSGGSDTVSGRNRAHSSNSTQLRQKKIPGKPELRSIVTEVFEGILESKVKCGACKKVSVVHEPFQDLSLPIPGRKEMAKTHQRSERECSESSPASGGKSSSSFGLRSFSTVFNLVSQVRDMFSSPPTSLHDCLEAFFGPSELKGGNQYYCSRCKKFQNSQKEMIITKLPEVLCIHLKRFRFDAYFSSKISRHIAFPMHDLDMRHYVKDTTKPDNFNYELCAIITHYGGAGGGHYVAFAKNSAHNTWFEFNDTRVSPVSPDTVINAEGYVLFYKHIPPSGSVSLQNIELSSLLLPCPGGPPDAPNPVVYLSRHWLHLLRTCSTPGPIFQHEFACEHGAVLPNRCEHARNLAMAVRRDVWDSYQQRFGGGPMVLKLEVCSTCKTLLDIYTERRKREKEDIYRLQSLGHGQVEKSEPFFLSQCWLQQWQNFIHCTTLAVGPPGPVDNSDLVQEVQTGSNQLRLAPARGPSAYHKISWKTWQYISQTYGGGPVITSSMTPPPPYDHAAALKTAWL